jgi:hypothetical protein
MAIITRDGAVIPAHMNLTRTSDRMDVLYELQDGNYALRVGYIIATHHPGKDNPTNKYVVYDVVCPQVSAGGAEAFVTYFGCKVASMFGSATDWERKTLRAPKSYTGPITAEFLATSTKVLLLCGDGRKSAPFIVAAGSNIDAPKDSAEDGHNWEWEFNGINWKIDKEGQLSLTHKGPTVGENNETLPADPEVAGSFLKFDKDGSITLDDATGESVTIDKKNKKIIINSREMAQNVTEKNWTVEVAKDVDVHAGGNIILNGDGKTYIGKEGSTEPLVRGNQLVTALSELVSIFTSQPAIGALGQVPVTINPFLAAALVQWQAKYGTPSAPILSKDKFTE